MGALKTGIDPDELRGFLVVKDLRNILNGVVYGITLIIPGVSATIFAIMLGFYDELICKMNHFREERRKNLRYFAAFLLGVAAGAVVFSSIVLFLLANYSFQTMMFFMGLLAGIVPLIALKTRGPTRKISPREVVLAVFFLLALLAVPRLMTVPTADPADAGGAINVALLLYVLLAGVINGATLVIPGLSGAFLLLIMGLYPLVIHSISSVGVYIGDLGNISLLGDICLVLLPFGIGGVIGLLGMARLMEKLMRDYQEAVYAAILGMILGSLITLFLDHALYGGGMSAAVIAVGAALFCGGCAAAYVLGKRCDHG